MRTIGDQTVTLRYIGQRHAIGRYVGEQQIFSDYIHQGLLHHFDGKNNTGEGVFDPNAAVWVDLVTGVQATLQSVSWQNFGVLFASAASKVFYEGQSVQHYTIFNTHRISALQGVHPRIFGEIPYPTLYLNSNVNINYAYAFFGQGKDTPFLPHTIPAPGETVYTAIRFGGNGVIELFFNGLLAATIASVLLDPAPAATMYIGCRAANDRTFSGEIFEHLVYDRPLSDAEIYHTFLLSQQRYP